MDEIFKAIFQLLWEIVGQVVAATLFLVLRAPFTRDASPGVAGIGCLVIGFFLGLLSLAPMPHAYSHGYARIATLLVVPALVAWALEALGHWRVRRGGGIPYLCFFPHAWLLAASLALMRFWGAS